MTSTSGGLWLKLSAHFHEHPKMLHVRSKAGRRAAHAELGWYRLLMAAKRYGRWEFASEAHLRHALGEFQCWLELYREAKLLDNLAIHDGDDYNTAKSDAERKREQRERERMDAQMSRNGHAPDVTPDVTGVTPREEKSREKERNGHDVTLGARSTRSQPPKPGEHRGQHADCAVCDALKGVGSIEDQMAAQWTKCSTCGERRGGAAHAPGGDHEFTGARS